MSMPLTTNMYYTPGFSISFGVDGLTIKVGGRRSECHRHEPLAGSGGMPHPPPPRKNLEGQMCRWCVLASSFVIKNNRPFSKMAAENLNKSKLKTNTSTRALTLATLPSFSISDKIPAEKM